MIYSADQYDNLPTLDALLNHLRVALSQQPVQHRSPIESVVMDQDAFIATRQMSGRYSLKPNISRQSALFRGEPKYGENYTCRPRMFRSRPRYLVQNIKYEELQIAMESYPLFQLLREGVMLDDDFLFRIYNPNGIAMCYGIDTSLLPFTSSLEIASFYACCEQDQNGVYHPVHKNEGEQKKGVLYIFSISAPFARIPGLSSVGLQPFERCGRQRTFALDVPMGQDLRNHRFVAGFVFRQENEISDRIFHQLNEGSSLSPETDILGIKARDIILSNVVSKVAFDRNLRANPSDNEAANIRELSSKGFNISNERCTAFSNEELNTFYANSIGIWERFCSNIVFTGKNSERLKESLLDVPNRADYRHYFNR